MIASADRRLLRYSLRGLFVLTTFCAVAAWIYRKFYVPPLSQIAGLSVETASDKGAEVLFDERATLQTVEHLLGNLKDGSTFWFYDSQWEALSDPGVFVTIAHHDGECVVKFSNHGWSSDWVSVPRDQVIKYVWACRNDNRKGRRRFYATRGMRFQFDARPLVKLDKDSGQHIRDYIRTRIES